MQAILQHRARIPISPIQSYPAAGMPQSLPPSISATYPHPTNKPNLYSHPPKTPPSPSLLLGTNLSAAHSLNHPQSITAHAAGSITCTRRVKRQVTLVRSDESLTHPPTTPVPPNPTHDAKSHYPMNPSTGLYHRTIPEKLIPDITVKIPQPYSSTKCVAETTAKHHQ